MVDKQYGPQALDFIYRYWLENEGNYPTSAEIAEAIGISVNQWGRVRGDLIAKKLLVKSAIWKIELTDMALEKLRTNAKRVQEAIETNFVELPLFGSVKAGSGARADDLRVHSGDETVTVAFKSDNSKRYFVLTVEGLSMIHENILPGDLVIVERVPFLKIQDGDLVVARYLKEEYEYSSEDDFDQAIGDPSNFDGPTLKYFRVLYKSGQPIYRLSWQTTADESEYKIRTQYLDVNDIGKVVGVYRTGGTFTPGSRPRN